MSERILFLRREHLILDHETAIKEARKYGRVLRVRNLNDEIWLVRDKSFCPKGSTPTRYIEHGVVDDLSLNDPFAAFRNFIQNSIRVETVGWKD